MSLTKSNLQDSVRLVTSTNPENKRFGTGCAIHKDESGIYFLTCMHVVMDLGGKDAVIVDNHTAEVIAFDESGLIDLAVLYVKDLFDIPILDLGFIGETGDTIFTIGFREYGQNYSLNTIEGTLEEQSTLVTKRHARLKTWNLRFFVGSSLHRGNSGAPVIHQSKGKVLAIVSHREGNQKGMAIPVSALQEIWPTMPHTIIHVEQQPTKTPSTLLEHIIWEGAWHLLEHAAIQAITSGGMAAMNFYRQSKTLSLLPQSIDAFDQDLKAKNPSTVADLQATVAILQTIDSYLWPKIARDWGFMLYYLGEETEYVNWLEKNLRHEIFKTIKSPQRFFSKQDNVLRVILDGIDGTGSFTHGIPLFCSGVAILVDNQVRVSAIYDPIHHIVYSALLKGPRNNPEAETEAWAFQVATGNRIDLVQLGEELEQTEPSKQSIGIHLTRSNPEKLHEFLKANSPSDQSVLERLANTFGGIYALNSGILAMADVARGALGGFVNNWTNLYDVAAGEVLVRACGGQVTNFNNQPIDYSNPEKTSLIVSRHDYLHSRLYRTLEGHTRYKN